MHNILRGVNCMGNFISLVTRREIFPAFVTITEKGNGN
jgi:hypothetical protein